MRVTITLETMKFHAYHGVMEEERIIGGTFLADVSYVIDTSAVETDNLDDTISYAEVYSIIKKEMNETSKLIEHVAGRIMNTLKSRFPQMSETTIRISKLTPPVDGEAERATVSITC